MNTELVEALGNVTMEEQLDRFGFNGLGHIDTFIPEAWETRMWVLRDNQDNIVIMADHGNTHCTIIGALLQDYTEVVYGEDTLGQVQQYLTQLKEMLR